MKFAPAMDLQLPVCCARHRALCTTDGVCGEVADDDVHTLYHGTTKAITSAHPEDYIEWALRALRVLCETLLDERRARESAQRSEKKARDIAKAERRMRKAVDDTIRVPGPASDAEYKAAWDALAKLGVDP